MLLINSVATIILMHYGKKSITNFHPGRFSNSRPEWREIRAEKMIKARAKSRNDKGNEKGKIGKGGTILENPASRDSDRLLFGL